MRLTSRSCFVPMKRATTLSMTFFNVHLCYSIVSVGLDRAKRPGYGSFLTGARFRAEVGCRQRGARKFGDLSRPSPFFWAGYEQFMYESFGD